MKLAMLSLLGCANLAHAFLPANAPSRQPWNLKMAEEAEAKEAKVVSGEELEVMLTEWDSPLVVDAYATWYACLISLSFSPCSQGLLTDICDYRLLVSQVWPMLAHGA